MVKELILTSPPRVVLDLMLPENLASAASAPKVKAKAKPKSEPAAQGATRAPAEAPPQVAAAPKAADTSKAAQPQPKVEKPKTAVKAEPPKAESPKNEPAKAEPPKTAMPKTEAPKAEAPKRPAPPVETAKPVPTPPATAPTPTPATRFETALEGDRLVAPKGEGAGEVEIADAAPAKPTPPVAKPAPAAAPKTTSKPTPVQPASKPASGLFGLDLGSDPRLQYGMVGGAALLFLIVVALLLRKHSRRTSLDALESAREPMAGDSFDSDSASGVGAGMGMGMGAERETYRAAGPGLFDDDSEKGDMDMAAQIPMDREQRRMTQGAVGGDSDAGLRELERRMTQLEGRLDQANEARERLERQVTAQSEELRVQRAAIARTQRALRGMTRGGEEATEPALRDPSKPPTTRP